jgi:hypothetical protein
MPLWIAVLVLAAAVLYTSPDGRQLLKRISSILWGVVGIAMIIGVLGAGMFALNRMATNPEQRPIVLWFSLLGVIVWGVFRFANFMDRKHGVGPNALKQ